MSAMNNSLLEIMKDSTESGHAAYVNFVMAYVKNNQDLVYCFFEGDEDKKYYGARIEFAYHKKCKYFTCGGKDKVVKVRELIKNRTEYNAANVLFFVDKDYSDDKTNNTLYVTPFYSIENFYSSKETLARILQDEFNMNNNEDIQKVINLYEDTLKTFHNKLLFLNAWLACQHDIRMKTKIDTRLNINDALKKYFNTNNIFNKDLRIKVNIFDDLENIDILEKKLFPNSPRILIENIEEKKIILLQSNPSHSFRGKFEFKFFIDFLKKIKEEVGSRNQKLLTNRYKCKISFGIDTGILTLTTYAITPSCLKSFLENNLTTASFGDKI